VICFQNLYLWYSDTTLKVSKLHPRKLWFAFKIYIFDILIQPSCSDDWKRFCCDLLSKFISLIFWYNFSFNSGFKDSVVICFQNLYLWYSDTTRMPWLNTIHPLWFAFKIYIFDILIQLFLLYSLIALRCDLLSKFISLIFWYNSVSEEDKGL